MDEIGLNIHDLVPPGTADRMHFLRNEIASMILSMVASSELIYGAGFAYLTSTIAFGLNYWSNVRK